MSKIMLFISLVLLSAPTLAGGLNEAFLQSAAGMRTQSERMKVVAQNLANVSTTGQTPGAEPYRRKQIYFKNKVDKKTGLTVVQVDKIKSDRKTPLNKRFDPSHPAADQDGYVLLPNVEASLENVDMKEAERSYEANLGAIETTKKMVNSTVDLLR